MNLPTRPEYVKPAFRVVLLNMENAICDSPLPGGNEDIEYGDL